MPNPFGRLTLSVAGTLVCLAGFAGSSAHAQGPATPTYYASDYCDDDCDRCGHRESFCHKLKLHCTYSGRKCSRPFVRVNGVPPELAPYIGPGTYHSPGYGLPYGGGYGANSSCYGYPQTAPQGYTR